MRHTFRTEQWVPYPVEQVFAFFGNPENLPKLMPAWQDARIESAKYIAPPPNGNMRSMESFAGAGTRMTISFRAFPLSPIRMTWEAVIVEFEWNDHFCDEQPRGPFAYWRHCHRVSSESHGGTVGTRVVDDLIYALPLGFLAEPVHLFFVRDQIRKVFEYRQRRLLELLKWLVRAFSLLVCTAESSEEQLFLRKSRDRHCLPCIHRKRKTL